jgi:alkanesulfonate monooxygenase SsuD/methylene tetrahydromethanopterin reductase-like flavin-dependent oxidoreductase (luciferase family)
VEQVMANTLVGTPDQVLARVEAEARAGVDHIMLHAVWGLPTEAGMRSLELFANKVARPLRAGQARLAAGAPA